MISPSYTFRIKPHIKNLAERICEAEERTLSNLIHVAILEYGRKKGWDADRTIDPHERRMTKAA